MRVELALILELLSCAFMTGLIWVIQILHYPAFALIQVDKFKEFHAGHSQKITYLVGPVMALELCVALYLVWDGTNGFFWTLNLALLLLIWLSTGLLSVPLHNQLALGSEEKLIFRLVRTNWWRTLLWSSRSLLLLIFTYQTLAGLQKI